MLLLILPLLLLTGCKGNDLEKISRDLNTYSMNITYNDDHSLDVTQEVQYTNRTGDSLESIKFHLYPRNFRKDSKCSVVSSLNYDKCYYNGVSFGDLVVSEVSVNEENTEIVLGGNDQDILEVPVNNLGNNQSVTIDITYHVDIPNISHRFGYGEDTINLGNFYPIACVYEDGDFRIDSYHYNGDPFYSEVANYNVSITAPSNLVLASSGNVTSTNTSEDSTTYSINASAIRDFAFVLSDKFNVVSDTVGNTRVSYYYYKNQYPNESLKASMDALSTFNRIFGEYPYDTLNVVETNFVHGGMEYPNMVMISDDVDVQSDYVNVIVHEIAHQWWYGLVGNNEYDYGWLDEGLTEYSTLLFYEENPSYNINTSELIKNTTNSFVTFVDVYTKVFGSADTTMNRALNEYNNESEYVYIAYVKGMLLFNSIDEILGRDKFLTCLQHYFDTHKFKVATPSSMIESFEQSCNSELNAVFESWINGKVKIIAVA